MRIMFEMPENLEGSSIQWLLEEANPSIRYFALRDILGKDENDSQVVAAKQAILESRIVKKILEKQNPAGYWEEPANPYHPKYKSSYWQIMTLSQLGVDKKCEKLRKACEYIFQFQLDEGGFTSETR